MGSRKIGGSYNCSEIMRIFYIIQYYNKGILSGFLCILKYIRYFRILIGCALCDYTLMVSCHAHTVQPVLIDKLDLDIPFFSLTFYSRYRPVVTPVEHKQPVNRFTGAKGLYDRVPAFYCKFFIFHNISLSYN